MELVGEEQLFYRKVVVWLGCFDVKHISCFNAKIV
jgi:hypothetical protein